MSENSTIDVPNVPFYTGPNAAGMGRSTPASALDADGTAATIYDGRNAFGVSKNQIGPNAAGQPKAVTQPS